jgi:hypothetical protein
MQDKTTPNLVHIKDRKKLLMSEEFSVSIATLLWDS